MEGKNIFLNKSFAQIALAIRHLLKSFVVFDRLDDSKSPIFFG
jgi:hypothetical protein